MWAVIPLSQLGTWNGNCIYKIKDGSRRCKLSTGGDTDVRRFGNRDELIAKISRGVSLTGQEKAELARGLCCLRWHSTENIAREICEMWARLPTTVLVPLPSLQSEVQRLKAEKEVLVARFQNAKAMEKQYYENWVGTFPQFESLKAEIEELKTLEETRQVSEVSDGNEFLTTKFGIPRERVLPKGTFSVPAVTAETPILVTPVKRTISSKFKTPADTKIINFSLEDSGYYSHASSPDRTSSVKKVYSASPTRRPRASSSSSSDSLILIENGHEAFDLAAPYLSPITPFSATTTKSEVAEFPFAAPINVNKFSPYSCNLTPALASAALQSTIERDLRKTDTHSRIVYGFRTSSTSPYVKIGVTGDFDRRMREHLQQGISNDHMVFKFESIHGGRVEGLIHKHLGRERRRERGDENGLGRQKWSRIEWFEVTDERARVVANGWRAWMAREPYVKVTAPKSLPIWKLKSEWGDKLSLVRDNHEEQDVWLDWLNSVAPGFVSDPAAHLKAVLPVAIAPQLFPAIDSSDGVHEEVKQEPDLESDICSVTREATHTPAPITTLAAVEQPATKTTEPYPKPLEVSPPPVGALLEKLLKKLLGVVIFLCWAGNLSFVQFTGFVVWASVVVWIQVEKGNLREMLQKYYYLEDVGNEYEVHEQVQIAVVRHSMVTETNDEVVGPGSLRKRGQWRMPKKFKFTFTAASPPVVFSY